jgi:hypothetical protein
MPTASIFRVEAGKWLFLAKRVAYLKKLHGVTFQNTIICRTFYSFLECILHEIGYCVQNQRQALLKTAVLCLSIWEDVPRHQTMGSTLKWQQLCSEGHPCLCDLAAPAYH